MARGTEGAGRGGELLSSPGEGGCEKGVVGDSPALPPPSWSWDKGWTNRSAYHGCRALGLGCSEGLGPRDLLLAEPVGRVWGPGPTPSLSSLMPAAAGVKFQPQRHRIPGWGPERPQPAPPFRAHLAAPPDRIRSPPPGLAKSPKVQGRTLGNGEHRTLENRGSGEARKVGVQSL